MRKDIIAADRQPATPSIAEALNEAEALIQSKRYQEALSLLQRIPHSFTGPSISDESWRYHYLRGLTYFWLGKQVSAWKEVEEALGKVARAHPFLIIPKPEQLPAHIVKNLKDLRAIELALIEALEGRNSYENEGEKRLLERRIAEISASLENLTPIAKLHQLSGSILRHLGKLPEAVEHLEWAATAFRLSRNWTALAETLNRTALAYMAMGNLKNSTQMLEQAIGFCLKTENQYLKLIIQSNIALCQLLCGIWRSPLSTLQEVLTESRKADDFPRYANTLLQWGWANLFGGRLKAARRAFAEAESVAAKNNLIGVLKLCHGFWADLSIEEGKLGKAEEHLNKLLEFSRTTTPGGEHVSQAWQVLGQVQTMQKQYGLALKTFAICLEHLSQQPEKWVEGAVYCGMGTCHAKTDQERLARKEFKKSMEIFEECGNQWEKAKTFVIAAESGVFTQAEMEPDLAWAKAVFKRLEHPSWLKRTRTLLKKTNRTSRAVSLPVLREQTERKQIVRALLACNGNITQAAKKLGLLRETLRYKIRHYGIEV